MKTRDRRAARDDNRWRRGVTGRHWRREEGRGLVGEGKMAKKPREEGGDRK